MTHSYLLNREEPPQCVGCDKPFTVRHILLECVDFSNVRNKYYHVDTLNNCLMMYLLIIYSYS